MQDSVIHPFAPVWDQHSRVLILGSFPSVRSREAGFYYAHPQNRFWQVLAQLYEEDVPMGTDARRSFVLCHGIALWDSIASCELTGSSDASVRNAVPNDIAALIRASSIRSVYCNGRLAHTLYSRFCAKASGIEAVLLPSTSAANAAWKLDGLVDAWRVILPENKEDDL